MIIKEKILHETLLRTKKLTDIETTRNFLSVFPKEVSDEKAPLDVFAKNGYYEVGNKIFNHKYPALLEATASQKPITWIFNDDAYAKLNWKQPTGLTLRELYRIRAQQLRDKYDYLVLSFSGGADSTTVLKSFIDNGIHLDEIVCDWFLSHSDKLNPVSDDPDPENYFSEWHLTIKPVLEHVQKHHPKIKITITDSMQQINNEDQEDTLMVHEQLVSYVSIKRYRKISSILRNLNQHHESVAIVFGTDKPPVAIDKKNAFCVQFNDWSTWFKSTDLDYRRHVEYFFWTPDLPEIVQEQAHVIYNHIKLFPRDADLLRHSYLPVYPDPKKNVLRRQYLTAKNALIKQLVYPDWNLDFFQAQKPDSSLWCNQHFWLLKNDKLPAIQSWKSCMNAFVSLLDPKWLTYYSDHSNILGYATLYNKIIPIGFAN